MGTCWSRRERQGKAGQSRTGHALDVTSSRMNIRLSAKGMRHAQKGGLREHPCEKDRAGPCRSYLAFGRTRELDLRVVQRFAFRNSSHPEWRWRGCGCDVMERHSCVCIVLLLASGDLLVLLCCKRTAMAGFFLLVGDDGRNGGQNGIGACRACLYFTAFVEPARMD